MWVTPDATASRRTDSATARSFGGPNTFGPESCIAPNPRRLTCRSPSANVPDCSTTDIGDHQTFMPPSTTISMPVTWELSSEVARLQGNHRAFRRPDHLNGGLCRVDGQIGSDDRG